LRIAWQYRRFLNEQQALEERRYRQQELASKSWSPASPSLPLSISGYEFCNDFDLRKPAERSLFTGATIKCESLARGAHMDSLLDHCRVFISNLARPAGEGQLVGRLAFQSLCAPQCMQSCTDWEMLRFLQSLKSLLRVSNAVALITFPATLLTPSMAIRWQHLADILISVEAVLDDNKEMAGMLTDYPDILGFLRIHKLASINTQVPTIPEAAMHAMKVVRRKKLVLERLLFAPVDATSGDSKTGGAAGLLCGRPANASSPLDF
jgi:elongator complex protein 4